jgi:membrane protein
MAETFLQRAEKFLWSPPAAMQSGAGVFLMGVLRLVYAVGRDIASGQLTLRAMSLVYTTLLSIVPLIAFSFSVLKGFGFHREMEPLLYQFFEPLGEKGAELTAQIIGFVDNVSGRVLGGIGLLLLVYTVVSMVQKVENSFNWIWQVKRPRSLARRFSDYLSVILVGPILMLSAMGMIASISSTALVQQLTSIEPFGSGLIFAGRLMPIVIVSFVFAFAYIFVTNTKVRVVSALVGGGTAGVLWAITGKLFASFVVTSTKYAAIYSSFAIVIIALIWLYLNWMILLLGSQIAFYFQKPKYLRIGRTRLVLTGRELETVALDLMLRVGERFMEGPPPLELHDIANEVRLPEEALSHVAASLASSGLIERNDSGGLVPGRDLGEIRVADILEAVRRPDAAVPQIRSVAPASELVGRVERAVEQELSGQTLRELIESTVVSGG